MPGRCTSCSCKGRPGQAAQSPSYNDVLYGCSPTAGEDFWPEAATATPGEGFWIETAGASKASDRRSQSSLFPGDAGYLRSAVASFG